MNAERAEIQLLEQTVHFLDEKLIDEFVNQGHHLTGAFEGSLHGTVINTGNATRAIGQMANYGVFINRGVSAGNVPFQQGSGAGTSKYITALVNYWMLRGLNEKEATRAAFATAKVHKEQGMPSVGSYMYTSTGSRKTFINQVEEKSGPEVDKRISEGMDIIIDTLFHETESETI